jgi:hypothetical protein
VPVPSTEAIAGSDQKFWTEEEIEKVRKYWKDHYWGRGSKRKRRRKNAKKSRS